MWSPTLSKDLLRNLIPWLADTALLEPVLPDTGKSEKDRYQILLSYDTL